MKLTNYIQWFELSAFHSFFENDQLVNYAIIPVGESLQLLHNGTLKLRKHMNKVSFNLALPPYFDSVQEYLNDTSYYFLINCEDYQLLEKTVLEVDSKDEKLCYSNNAQKPRPIVVKEKRFDYTLPNGVTTIQVKNSNGEEVCSLTPAANSDLVHVNLIKHEDGVYELWNKNKLIEQVFITNASLDNTLAILEIEVGAVNATQPVEVTFSAMEAFWNYKVVIKADIQVQDDKISIEDFQNTSFSAPVKIDFITNTTTYEFNSSAAINLKEDFQKPIRLQLAYSDKFSVQTKQMEVILPNPSNSALKRFKEGDNKGELYLSKIVYI